MDEKRPTHDSLRNFNAHADRNGQDFGQDSPLDVARPADLERAMQEDPSWQAETARTASGFHRRDATEGGTVGSVEATEAETPAENLRRISDPSPTPKAG